jgi:phosphatidylserine decarboxylase
VNQVGERYVPKLFVRNQRVALYVATEGLGTVVVVMVGAGIVGRSSVRGVPGRDVPAGEHHLAPAIAVKKGDEIGVFHLGSTVVLLLEPGTIVARSPGAIQVGSTLLSAQ